MIEMEASTLGRSNMPLQRPLSIWIATAALIALAIGNLIVSLLIEFNRSTESKAVPSPMPWFFVVWLVLGSIGAWTGRGPRWMYLFLGALVGSVFAIVIVVMAAGRSQIWQGYLFAACNGALFFTACAAMATESASRFFAAAAGLKSGKPADGSRTVLL
jgi:hypothetical protein